MCTGCVGSGGRSCIRTSRVQNQREGYCRLILEVESPALDQSVFGRASTLPLSVLNEGNFEKVAGNQSKLKKYWRRNAVLSFCVTSSSAEKRRLFVVFTLKKQDVILAGTQTYKHPLPINALLF